MRADQQIDDTIRRETEAFIERVTKMIRPIVDTEFRKDVCNAVTAIDLGTAYFIDDDLRRPNAVAEATPKRKATKKTAKKGGRHGR